MVLKEKNQGFVGFQRKDGEPLSEAANIALGKIKRGEPIYIIKADQMGDDMVYQWGCCYMLRKLASEVDLKEGKIILRSYNSYLEIPKGFVLFGNILHSRLDEDASLGIYGFVLRKLSKKLNLPITDQDVEKIPQPIRTDHAPLSLFDRSKVIKEGAEFREKTLEDHDSIIVINQAGRVPEKRFSDKQITELVRTTKDVSPKAFVVVASDQDLSKGYKFWQKPKQFEGADLTIGGKDINQLCKYFFAADTLVTTDTFWAWLGAGTKVMRNDRGGKLQEGDVVVLYTIADPDVFGIPGAEIVVSNVLLDQKWVMETLGDLFLKPEWYYGKDGVDLKKIKKGVRGDDFEKIRQRMIKVLNIDKCD